MGPETIPTPSAAPILFGGRFGWLHAAAPGRPADVGVVIVSPLGRDARCVHLPMRLLAERLAAQGLPTLRYDHADTGDSLDLPADADALPVWLADIAGAVEVLKARTDVARVVLCGVRLGATLAAAAAPEVEADGLILFGPVVSGRSWTAKAAFAARAAGVSPGPGAALDVEGLQLSPATVRSLSALDLLDPAPPPRVLVFTHGRTTDAYVHRLRQAGAAVTEAPFTGHEDLFLESHSNLAPEAAFACALAWLADTGLADANAAPASRVRPAAVDTAPALRTGTAVERPVSFGAGLHGVLCTPADGRRDGPAVLFCNTGGDPRAGIGRFAVDAGRRLAADGVSSLRFDFAGLGDSPAPAGEPRSHVYTQDRGADMDAALAFMAAEGLGRISACGVCSGAYHAMHAAMRDGRLEGVFAVNPLRLVWTGEEIVFGERTASYVDRLGDPAAWRSLLGGQVQVGALLRMARSRLLARLTAAVGAGPTRELHRGLARLSARGGRMHLMVGAEDAALEEVEAYLGRGGARLARLPGGSVQVEPGLDHGLARRASREAAFAALRAWLGLQPPQPAAFAPAEPPTHVHERELVA